MGQIDVLKMIDELREEKLEIYPGDEDIARLGIIQIGDNVASNLYIKSKKAEMGKWKIGVEHMQLPENIEWPIAKDKIEDMCREFSINGVILQLPLPEKLQKYEKYLIDTIYSHKNVDGFKQFGAPNPYFTPCTPAGIMHIMKKMRGELTGKTVCVIGRGKTVGDPLIDILKKEPCSLICCNSNTPDEELEKILGISDIVVTAVGKPGLINAEMLKDGALVIDAGISYVNGKQTGDFDNSSVASSGKSIDYTPWTNGVGKMTVAQLAINTINAMEWQRGAGA